MHDAAFCAFSIGALFSTKPPLDIEASVEMDPGPAVAAKDPPESVVPSKDQAIVDDTGVRVGDDVVIGADGVRIGDAVKIDADNFKFDATKFDKRTSDQLGLALDAIADQCRKMAALESRELMSFSLFWLVYSTFFLTVWSATPGKRLWKMSLIRYSSQ
jgi:hypothetical protein